MIEVTQRIPRKQKNTILTALMQMEAKLNNDILANPNDEEAKCIVEEIVVLKALLEYNMDISMSEIQHKHFKDINGVAYPMYGCGTHEDC